MKKHVLIADEGMLLTDGTHYGKQVSVSINRDPSEFWQIPESDYVVVEEEQLSDSDALAILMGEEVQTDDEAGSDGAESGDGESGGES